MGLVFQAVIFFLIARVCAVFSPSQIVIGLKDMNRQFQHVQSASESIDPANAFGAVRGKGPLSVTIKGIQDVTVTLESYNNLLLDHGSEMKGSHIGSVCDAFVELSKKLNGVMCSLDSKSIDVYNSRLHGHVVAHPIRELGFAVFAFADRISGVSETHTPIIEATRSSLKESFSKVIRGYSF